MLMSNTKWWLCYFLIPRQSFYGKRAKSLEKFGEIIGEIFSPALEMQFGQFY